MIIAAVDGIAYGGGFELALACDLIVAGQNALQFPRNRARVSRRTRWMRALADAHFPYVALDWLLTGRTVGAREALSHGAISRISEGRPGKRRCASPNRSPQKILPPAKR